MGIQFKEFESILRVSLDSRPAGGGKTTSLVNDILATPHKLWVVAQPTIRIIDETEKRLVDGGYDPNHVKKLHSGETANVGSKQLEQFKNWPEQGVIFITHLGLRNIPTGIEKVRGGMTLVIDEMPELFHFSQLSTDILELMAGRYFEEVSGNSRVWRLEDAGYEFLSGEDPRYRLAYGPLNSIKSAGKAFYHGATNILMSNLIDPKIFLGDVKILSATPQQNYFKEYCLINKIKVEPVEAEIMQGRSIISPYHPRTLLSGHTFSIRRLYRNEKGITKRALGIRKRGDQRPIEKKKADLQFKVGQRLGKVVREFKSDCLFVLNEERRYIVKGACLGSAKYEKCIITPGTSGVNDFGHLKNGVYLAAALPSMNCVRAVLDLSGSSRTVAEVCEQTQLDAMYQSLSRTAVRNMRSGEEVHIQFIVFGTFEAKLLVQCIEGRAAEEIDLRHFPYTDFGNSQLTELAF